MRIDQLPQSGRVEDRRGRGGFRMPGRRGGGIGIGLVIVLGLIGSFQGGFVEALIITNGGPGYSTTFYSLYLYRTAFLDFHMGYASALAWFLFVIIMAFTALQMSLSKRWVYYEGESQQSEGR